MANAEKPVARLQRKTVLDIGCGYGWHFVYAAEQVADAVIGIDISEKMLEAAREKTRSTRAVYKR